MLYHLSPSRRVTWCDLPGRSTITLAQEHGADLARIDWRPAEARAFSGDLLRLALRYGIDCTDGIVIAGEDVIGLGRSDELRLLNHQSTEAQNELRAQSPFMERLIPGWTERGEELDRRISDSMERTARAADAELAKQMAASPKPELVEHWRRVGGDLPDPL